MQRFGSGKGLFAGLRECEPWLFVTGKPRSRQLKGQSREAIGGREGTCGRALGMPFQRPDEKAFFSAVELEADSCFFSMSSLKGCGASSRSVLSCHLMVAFRWHGSHRYDFIGSSGNTIALSSPVIPCFLCLFTSSHVWLRCFSCLRQGEYFWEEVHKLLDHLPLNF